MSNDVAHKRWWQIFEVVFGIPFLVAIVLQRVVSFSLPREFLIPVIMPIGSFFIVVGVSLAVLARREFARFGQPTDPELSTIKIIATGVFSRSRNPLYLGGIIILTGISLAFNLPWALILLFPSIVTCQYILVVPEEGYLLAKFGTQYQEYASAVHRLIGRK